MEGIYHMSEELCLKSTKHIAKQLTQVHRKQSPSPLCSGTWVLTEGMYPVLLQVQLLDAEPVCV